MHQDLPYTHQECGLEAGRTAISLAKPVLMNLLSVSMHRSCSSAAAIFLAMSSTSSFSFSCKCGVQAQLSHSAEITSHPDASLGSSKRQQLQ